MLKYVSGQNIDHEKWIDLVQNAANSTVFCSGWYMSALCEWDAIVLDDYKGAIALPVKKKFGLTQLYQPSFMQHSSWFGQTCDTSELSILLRKHFQDIRFNSYTELDLEKHERINIELLLDKDAKDLYQAFRKDLKKNLRKSEGLVQIIESVDPSSSIDLYRTAYGTMNTLGDTEYNNFKSLFNIAYSKGNAICLEAFHEDQLIASLCFMQFKNRMHYVLGAPNEKGKELNALSQVFWYLIQKHANTSMVIDFEGSSIQSVARFYKSFGSKVHSFYEYSYAKGITKMMRSILK